MAEALATHAIKEGVKHWNVWRSTASINSPDLSNANLRGMELANANMTHVVGDGVILIDSILERANFTRASLASANLSDSKATSCRFNEALMQRARLQRANISEADFSNANLYTANLSRCFALNANFSFANLERADLKHASLNGSKLRRANLTEAVLAGADIRGADLSDAEGLTQGQIDVDVGDIATLLPPGIRRPLTWVLSDADGPSDGTQLELAPSVKSPPLITPLPIDWRGNRIAAIPPAPDVSAVSNETRNQLISALRELAIEFAKKIENASNVDRRVARYATKYASECKKEPNQVYPILLDSYIRIIRYTLQQDPTSFPAWAVAEYEVWSENHNVLEQAYPILREFREAVRITNIPEGGMPSEELSGLQVVIDSESARVLVDTIVRNATQDQLEQPDRMANAQLNKHKHYSVSAMVGRIWQLLKKVPSTVKANAEFVSNLQKLRITLTPFIEWVKTNWRSITWFD